MSEKTLEMQRLELSAEEVAVVKELVQTLVVLKEKNVLQDLIEIGNWISLFATGLISTIILMAIYWFLGFSKNQKNLLVENLSKIKFLKLNG